MSITNESIIKAIGNYKYTYANSRFLSVKELKPKQLANVMKHICPNASKSEIVAVLDDSFSSNGK